eukprot:3522121-Alexandrium_andersonii.AAC.1
MSGRTWTQHAYARTGVCETPELPQFGCPVAAPRRLFWQRSCHEEARGLARALSRQAGSPVLPTTL